MTSLLNFYQQHAITPVRQTIDDLPAHFARRAGLYRSLGLPPFAIEGRTVLEVGPGTGDNALYTASLKPARYVLLEPNPAGYAALSERWPTTHGGRDRWEFRQDRIEDYDGGTFDLVLCEGLLGLCGGEPGPILEALVSHVKPGGVLVVTCIDPISDHAEVVRRAMAQRLIDRSAPLEEQLAILRPVFAPHLATLKGMTRSVDDWIIDNLLNPASIGPTFSIPDALTALDGRFELLGCSPRFLVDWRWYKEQKPGLQWAIDAYWEQANNLMDYRNIEDPQGEGRNRFLNARCVEFREQLKRYEIGEIPWPDPEETMTGGDGFMAWAYQPKRIGDDIGWFGRGQQYLSLVRV